MGLADINSEFTTFTYSVHVAFFPGSPRTRTKNVLQATEVGWSLGTRLVYMYMHSTQKNFRCFELDLTLCTQVYTHMDVHKAKNVHVHKTFTCTMQKQSCNFS